VHSSASGCTGTAGVSVHPTRRREVSRSPGWDLVRPYVFRRPPSLRCSSFPVGYMSVEHPGPTVHPQFLGSSCFGPIVLGRRGHRLTTLEETATTEESPMSHSDADKFADAVTFSYPAVPLVPPSPGEDHRSLRDGDGSEGARTASPRSPRPFTSARVGASRRVRLDPFSDPCTYLG
jgi:hypothetical protein